MKVELEIPDELARKLKQSGVDPLPQILAQALASWLAAHPEAKSDAVKSYTRNGILVHHSGQTISPADVARALADD